MNIFTIVNREIKYSPKNYFLTVISISMLYCTIITILILSWGYDDYMSLQSAKKEKTTEEYMNQVLRNYKQITANMAYTIRVLPATATADGFYTDGYAKQTMPLKHINVLYKKFSKDLTALIPVFRRKNFWAEQERTILKASIAPTKLTHTDSNKYYGYTQVMRSHIALGYEIHYVNNYKAGDTIIVNKKSYIVESCLDQRGSIDDITVWFNYNDLFPNTESEKKISEIWVWTDYYSFKEHSMLVQQINKILPDCNASLVLPLAKMKAKAVKVAEDVSENEIVREKHFLSIEYLFHKKFQRGFIAIIFFITVLFVVSSMFFNSMRRKKEIAIFSAIGYEQKLIIQLFIYRYLVIIFTGGGIGILLGIFFGLAGTSILWQTIQIDISVIYKISIAITINGIVAGILSTYILSKFDPAQILSSDRNL